MTKLVGLSVVLVSLVLAGCSLLPSDPANQNVNRPTDTAENDVNTNQGQAICVDRCGDGVCQEIVCLATGCPCVETSDRCPADCT